MSTIEAKIERTVNIDTPSFRASLASSFQFVMERFTAQGTTVTTDATTTDTSGLSRLRIVENHPLVPVYGVFNNDPHWDTYIQNMEEYKERINQLEASRD